MAVPKLRCFIASAFGYKDVDQIYTKAIKPILKEFDVVPQRVDQVVHNKDIDDMIFELMDDSSLCIADLTYARPSAYYEAGYMFGKGKPVVYIARADHSPKHKQMVDDNLRVHFDLLMKHRISWNSPDDAFKKRLRKQLAFVLTPLQKDRSKQIAIAASRQAFSAVSVTKRLNSLVDTAFTVIGPRKFSRVDGRFDALPPWLHMERTHKKEQQLVICAPRASVSRLEFNRLNYVSGIAGGIIDIPCHNVLILPLLKSISKATIESYLKGYDQISDWCFHQRFSKYLKVPVSHTIAVVPAVKSPTEFADRCGAILDSLKLT